MSAHTGRCFRQWRRTKHRKLRQGLSWDFPIRQKVPLALRPFLNGHSNQVRAGREAMQLAIMRYADHQQIVAAAKARSSPRGR